MKKKICFTIEIINLIKFMYIKDLFIYYKKNFKQKFLFFNIYYIYFIFFIKYYIMLNFTC
jgi:hypothetical protein